MDRGDETRGGRKRRVAGGRPQAATGDASPAPDVPADAVPEGSVEPVESGTSFEDEFAAAEKAVDALERGDLSLEESLRAYEDGLRALKKCHDVLQRAQRRIEVLGREIGAVAEDSDALFWKPATSARSLDEVMERVDREGELPPTTPSRQGPAGGQGSVSDDSGEIRSPPRARTSSEQGPSCRESRREDPSDLTKE